MKYLKREKKENLLKNELHKDQLISDKSTDFLPDLNLNIIVLMKKVPL